MRASSSRVRRLFVTALLLTWSPGSANGKVLEIPFDFSRGAIGVEVTVNGTPLYVLIDTGVDPSVIALNRVDALGLPMDRDQAGEASGYGEGTSSPVFSATIAGLEIGGRRFAPVEAVAADTQAMSSAYGRPLDGVLGYSFLKDKALLVDYAAGRLGILDAPQEAHPQLRKCRSRWAIALQFLEDDNTPIIPDFRLGAASGPVTLDTGSNGGIALFPRAAGLPGLGAALAETGEIIHSGARGAARSKSYTIEAPVGFGPFSLPPGQAATMHLAQAEEDKRIANVGNRLFAAMKLKILFDYPGKTVTFFGACG